EGLCGAKLRIRREHVHRQSLEILDRGATAFLLRVTVGHRSVHFVVGKDGGAPFVTAVSKTATTLEDAFRWMMPAAVQRAIAEGKGPHRSLLALGYAGWAPGQLDAEIKANGWLNVTADEHLIFGGKLDNKWSRAIGKLGIVDWREDCSSCHNCVKRGCVYGFYRDEADTLRQERGFLDYIFQCKGCLNCVQDCTKGILTRVVNPEYERLGDHYYTPEIIVSTWYQADTGRIPVSGSGYGGRFSGPGFDSMWTDMSEIVRPTRDGIHGREYINTSVDIGRKLNHLAFEGDRLAVDPPRLLENPLPIIFDVIPERFHRGPVVASVANAAAELGLMLIAGGHDTPKGATIERDNVIPLIEKPEAATDGQIASQIASQIAGPIAGAAMVMVPDCDDVAKVRAALKQQNPDQIVAIRLPATPQVAQRARQLADGGVDGGAEVLHLVFDKHGREDAPSRPRHMRDVLREVHGALTKDGIRDQITLIAS
ncbi:hypothetical protein LCGC14_2547520, partial [marine sediment metagenome]